MAAKYDPEREAHKAWLGLLQPVGLVVSPPALIKAQAMPDKNIARVQQAFEAVCERPPSIVAEPDPQLLDFPRFATEVLGWEIDDLAGAPGGPEIPSRIACHLPQYNDTLTPDYVAVDGMGDGSPLMLVSVVERGLPLDKPLPDDLHDGWRASPQARLERLLRETEVPAGLLLNGETLRLVYAPRGESSGHVGFPVAEMCTVHGRPILAALHMLLSEHRVFAAPDGQRLLDLLVESRKYQNEVSTRLADQVLGALWELLRGFQAADDAANGRVLFDLARTEPDHIYGGVLTTIMRLVFLLYAEDQGLMPDDAIYTRHYAVGGLFDQLRVDAGRYPDTMDQRFGAWSRLLSTFRLVYDGASHGEMRLPARHGQLFDPDAYPFLEGRPIGVARVIGERFDAPRVSDGVLWRVLDGLLMLDGERLSYRALDVEQIGSVYEAMMGFDVKTLPGRAIAVRSKDIVVDLDACLKQPPGKRKKWLEDAAETTLGRTAASALKKAETVEDIVAALDRKVSPRTPRPLPPGALFLQPGEERRRSGSHYTPRELTEPIVGTTLRPVLEGLGEKPTPEQILDLKVCDPAMGSGAFLVEACRQLAEALVESWRVHGRLEAEVPASEEPLRVARRRVAQRCLYGVDKNPFAVNLAKLSLWLVTLSRDHAFTFLDHALKCGDSLVGLTVEQIGTFRWDVNRADQSDPLFEAVASDAAKVTRLRDDFRASMGSASYGELQDHFDAVEASVAPLRLAGDLCVAAFLCTPRATDREAARRLHRNAHDALRAGGMLETFARQSLDELASGPYGLRPFHWPLEFPEVFSSERPGFSVMIGNPPYAGKNTIASGNRATYPDWLKMLHGNRETRSSIGSADLVAHFFRRGFSLLHSGGTLGFVATNTCYQGDTRRSGIGYLVRHGAHLYAATKRIPWPGNAAVVVTAVYLVRSTSWHREAHFNGTPVKHISPFLVPVHVDQEPATLERSSDLAFKGCELGSLGFIVDDDIGASLAGHLRPDGTPIMKQYVGGADLNASATPSGRLVVDVDGLGVEQVPDDVMAVLRAQLLADLQARGKDTEGQWWHFRRPSNGMRAIIRRGRPCLAIARVSATFGFTPLAPTYLPNEKIVLFDVPIEHGFCVLQSRVHEIWARTLSGTMKDDLQYAPSDCLETFPFPVGWEKDDTLCVAGNRYLSHREVLMTSLDVGLTELYGIFHDPETRADGIEHLRHLHQEMDQAVLRAYGWSDVPATCQHLLDYEIDEATWGKKKKKPWRLRWPDSVQDDVLGRLLKENRRRAVAESTHALPLFQNTEGSSE